MRGDALARFAAKCRFDPDTGCVVWTGGTSGGRAGEARYPAFWFEGKRWPGQRWAAIHIHGLPISDAQEAQHTCPNTLCVEHVARGTHWSGNPRQHWLLISMGYDHRPDDYEEDDGEAPPPDEPVAEPASHDCPEWFRPFWEASGG